MTESREVERQLRVDLTEQGITPGGTADPARHLYQLLPDVLAARIEKLPPYEYCGHQVSFRQAITPERMQGRMNATMRFLVWGTIPIGALMGGALGEALGLWPTILAMAVCELLAPLWVVFSPVRHLRTQPTPV